MNIKQVVNILKNGGVIVIPTDTVYGLACDALNIDAVDKIYKLKQRNYSKPMVVLVSDKDMLKKYTSSINKLEEELINEYLPGPMTIVLKKSNLIHDIVSSNKDTIGIRIPNNKELIDIIKQLDKPIVATSCNISNEDVITNISILDESIKNNVDYIYDGGLINRASSTIVKVDNDKVVILRNGDLSKDIKDKYCSEE